MEPTLVFTKQAISRSSSTSGSNIDFFAAPSSSLVHIGATYGEVILFFQDSNHYSDDSLTGGKSTKASKFVKVLLKVRTGEEVNAIELIKQTIDKAAALGTILKFDNTTKEYSIRGVFAVNNIIRDDELPTDDDIYLSCGTGGSATDIDPGVIDVASDSILFYDFDDDGLPKTTSVPDFIASIAGDNLTAINGVLNVADPELIPGGNKFAVLAKSSDTDYDYDWTESPTFESVDIAIWSTTANPELLFRKSRGSDHTTTTTEQNDVLGEIGFKGVTNVNNEVASAKIKVTQTAAADDTYVKSKLELFTGTATGEQVALTINDERVTILPNQSTTPSAVQGGIYADNNDILFFGVS
jgi:hypothetical protein